MATTTLSPSNRSYDPFARGAAPVGVRTIELCDESRGGRTLTVELWYPAIEAYRGQDLDDATRDRFTFAPGQPEAVQSAVRNADPAEGRFPLIVQSHGANRHRRDRTELCTHLASHGYIVASPDFPGDNVADMIQDTLAKAGARTTSMSIDELAEYRPVDAAFVLEGLLAGAEPALSMIVDPERVGACGHSYGGWTTLALNSINRKPLASFVMAPAWGKRSPLSEISRLGPRLRFDDWGRPVSTFLLAGERDNCVILDDLRELHAALPSPKRFAVLRGAGHMHFADNAEQVHEFMRAMWSSPDLPDPENNGPALAESARPFSELCPAVHAPDAMRALCLAHMDAHLKDCGEARAFLNSDLAATFASRGIGLEVL
jgi:predicted dienelactone hydrolase